MKTLSDVKDRAAISYKRGVRSWVFGEQPQVSIALGSPTKAQAYDSPEEIFTWIDQWKKYSGPGEVTWSTKRLGNFGATQIPTHLRLTNADEVATLVGKKKELDHILSVKAILGEVPEPALRSTFGHWRHYNEAEAHLVTTVVRWLSTHDASTYYIRELPIRGVHTKWIENHKAILTAALGELQFHTPEQLCEFRTPEFHGALPLEKVTCPEMCATILIVENRTSFLALPDIDSLMVVNGSGFGARRLGGATWLEDKHILYWGDMDVHGFHILDSFRVHCPHTESILMDMPTARAYVDLGVEDKNATFPYTHLTKTERNAIDFLKENNLRIEQERIMLSDAVTALQASMKRWCERA